MMVVLKTTAIRGSGGTRQLHAAASREEATTGERGGLRRRERTGGTMAAPAVVRTGRFPPMSADIVIVGNGIAGMTSAVEAHRLAPEKKILMVTEQNHSTINAPALKQFAIGKLSREHLLAFPEGVELAHQLRAIRGRVTTIDAEHHRLSLAGEFQIGYTSLLLATGSAPVGLPVDLPGRDYDGVLVLHRMRDYLDLRRRLPEAQEVVVIGGGWHAAETALSLASFQHLRVHWLMRGQAGMSHALDPRAFELVLEQAYKARVSVYLATEVAQIHGHIGAVAGVITTRGEAIRCQLVLACTGTVPATDLAAHCNPPLRCERGFVVQYGLRTSATDIYCSGDAAALWDPQQGGYAPRAQWHAAVSQGRYAAHAMLASKAYAGPSPFGARWHATQIGELTVLTAGAPLSAMEGSEVITEDTANSYRRMVVVGDRLVGYLSLGRDQPEYGLFIKELIDSGRSVTRCGLLTLKGVRTTGALAWIGGSA